MITFLYLFGRISKKKGLIFTLDGIFSLIIVFGFFLFLMMQFSYQPQISSADVQLSFLAEDMSQVIFHKDFNSIFIDNPSSLVMQDLFNDTLKSQFCGGIFIFNDTSFDDLRINFAQMSSFKTGCFEEDLNDISLQSHFKRLLSHNNNLYVMEVIIWLK